MRIQRRVAVFLLCMMTMLLAACGQTAQNTDPNKTAVTNTEDANNTEEAVTTTKKPSDKNTDAKQTKAPATKKPVANKSDAQEVEVQFIDIGQGDSILVKSNGKTMLVDAGNNEYGEGLVGYLKNQGITKIDYLVGTHPDADHIGGLDIVINKLEIGKIYMPKKQSNTKTFEDVLTAIANKGLKITAPKVGDRFKVGSAEVTILGPVKSYDDNNNCSIVLKVTNGQTSFLLTGDAELEAEEDLAASGADLSATVLKVGHHGSHSSTSQTLLRKVNPKYAVISCGIDNKYGHPHKETMTYLKRANVNVYRTDEQQTVTMISNGTEITVKTGGESVKASEKKTYQTPKKESVATKAPQSSTSGSYIGNKNTKKFHVPSCSSLPAKSNRVMFDTREEAVAAGYDACGRCHP